MQVFKYKKGGGKKRREKKEEKKTISSFCMPKTFLSAVVSEEVFLSFKY